MCYNYNESATGKWRPLAYGLVAGALGVCISANAARAATPNDVQYHVSTTIPSGNTSTNDFVIATVPAGKLLVITSVSYYRQNFAANSIGQLYIDTVASGTGGDIGLPEAKADGAVFPGATLTTTLYVDAGQAVSANLYTNIAPNGPETDFITVTGYLLPQK